MNKRVIALCALLTTAVNASVVGPNVERDTIKKQLDAGRKFGFGSNVVQLAAGVYLLKGSELPDEIYETKAE